MDLQFKVDMRQYRAGMREIAQKQMPFAIAQALTMTAGRVGVGWQDEMRERLDRPSPFTVNSVSVRPARKSNLISTVFIRPVAAEYLEPYVDGGPRFMGNKRGLLGPRNVRLNQYGNLPRSKLATLKARGDVFVGPVKFKSGDVVNGVWQRQARGHRRGKLGRRTGKYGTKGSHNRKHNAGQGLTSATTLKLLIRFTDPQPVKERLDFRGRAEAAIRDYFQPNFERAFAAAMATAR